MTVNDHAAEFGGKPVVVYDTGAARFDPSTHAYRLACDYDDATPMLERLEHYLARPEAGATTALVVGAWGDPYEVTAATLVGALAEAAARLPHLEALFLGDMTVEECEISWIQQTDVAPLMRAYPKLQRFRVRGGEGLRFAGPLELPELRSLIVETGGLSRSTVADLVAARLPNLEELVLWLGDPNYGGDCTAADVAPLLTGELHPELRALGLCNSEVQDAIAAAVATCPLLPRLRVLDLSMGTLGDVGATALLESPALAGLERLDLHHHYITEAVAARLRALDLEVDLSDRQAEDDWGDGELHRYVAVAE